MQAPQKAALHPEPEEGVRHGRLAARPAVPRASVAPGTYLLNGRALLYVPPTSGESPSRLAVVLHGAGGTAEQALRWLRPQADAAWLALLAPQSLSSTWDMIVGGYGADVARLEAALKEVFTRTDIDAAGVAVAGFSDGASYALSLGVANGDLFQAVLAFSPGFMAPMVKHGHPRFFVSHGTQDRILPIDSSSRRLVAALRESGYQVTYEEFAGGHEVPSEVAAAAVRWWTAG